MKRLHRAGLFGWSAFQEHLDIDFNSVAWVHAAGNAVIDPLPLSPHDERHLEALGGVRQVIVTNSRHLRAAAQVVQRFGAALWAPAAERETFAAPVQRWLSEGDQPLDGLRVLSLSGSKTPGELALVIDGATLVVGDLVRSHRAGCLQLLKPEQGLADRSLAAREVERLAALPGLEAVLVGDGFCAFRDGARLLYELIETLRSD